MNVSVRESCCHALLEPAPKRLMKRMRAIQIEMANGKSDHKGKEGGEVDGIPVTTDSSSTVLRMGADGGRCIAWTRISVDLSLANDKRINTTWQPETQKRDLPRSNGDPVT